MRPRIKMGLIVGIIGLVLNACVSTFMGLCGPFLTLAAGAVAGFLTAQQEKLPNKGEGARAGAVAGAVTGGLMLVGQALGGIGALVFIQQSGTNPIFGTVPSPSADLSQQIIYYGTGLVTGLCFGVVGAALAALTGAGGGYLGTSGQPANLVS